MVKTLSQLYSEVRKALLTQEDPQTAGMYARNLVCHVTGVSPEKILSHSEHYVGQAECDTLQKAVERILQGEPLAYVLGEWDFYGMTLHVDSHVLIPRDDTCALANLAIGQALFLGSSPRILDLCTGSGCIGLAIAQRVPDAKVTLADLSRDALAVAKRNIVAHKLTSHVSCVQVDALKPPAPFLGKFDMIVSNPPYVTTEEMEELPHSVKDFEPSMALHGGEDGLDFYRAITRNFSAALKPGGYLCFEFGMGQGDAVCRLLEENGFTVLERVKDFNERERAVMARYTREEE